MTLIPLSRLRSQDRAAAVAEAPAAATLVRQAWSAAASRCEAEWRRPDEVWHCTRRLGHRWRHHFVRS